MVQGNRREFAAGSSAQWVLQVAGSAFEDSSMKKPMTVIQKLRQRLQEHSEMEREALRNLCRDESALTAHVRRLTARELGKLQRMLAN